MTSIFRRRDAVIIISLTSVAIGTRVVGLADWHLWGDEYYTFFDAYDRFKGFLNPAYYALTVFSFKLYGVTEWAARLPSFIFGVLSVPLLFLSWRTVVGNYASVTGAMFLLMSSWHLWHSQQARFYSAVILLGLLAYYWFYRSIREGRFTFLLLGAAASFLAVLFHLTAIIIPVAFGVFSLLVVVFRERAMAFSLRIAGTVLAIGALVGLVAFPFLWRALGEWSALGQTWGYGPAGFVLQTVKYLQLPYVVIGGFGLIAMARRDFWVAVYFATGIVVPIFFLMGASLLVTVRPDYLIYVLPLVTLLAGVFCEEVRKGLHENGILKHSIVAIVLVTVLPEFVSHYTDRMTLDIRDAYSYVERHYQKGDRVMSFLGGFNYYTEKQYQLDKIPGNPYDNSANWERGLKSFEQPGTRAWIILPTSRKQPAKRLKAWLSFWGQLVWTDTALRFDYTYRGYEVYLIDVRLHSQVPAKLF